MNPAAHALDVDLAQRVAHLGTETVFAVSAEAAALAAQGKTVYPFHLGDLNLPTPENIVEASFRAVRDGETHPPENRDGALENLREWMLVAEVLPASGQCGVKRRFEI